MRAVRKGRQVVALFVLLVWPAAAVGQAAQGRGQPRQGSRLEREALTEYLSGLANLRVPLQSLSQPAPYENSLARSRRRGPPSSVAWGPASEFVLLKRPSSGDPAWTHEITASYERSSPSASRRWMSRSESRLAHRAR
jgi:hypothetical protein